MKYMAMVEKAGRGFSGFFPDLDAEPVQGRNLLEVRSRLQAALVAHLAANPGAPRPPERTSEEEATLRAEAAPGCAVMFIEPATPLVFEAVVG